MANLLDGCGLSMDEGLCQLDIVSDKSRCLPKFGVLHSASTVAPMCRANITDGTRVTVALSCTAGQVLLEY